MSYDLYHTSKQNRNMCNRHLFLWNRTSPEFLVNHKQVWALHTRKVSKISEVFYDTFIHVVETSSYFAVQITVMNVNMSLNMYVGFTNMNDLSQSKVKSDPLTAG